MSASEKQIEQQITEFQNNSSFRSIQEVERVGGAYVIRNGEKLLSFCSNDYFGLSSHPAVIDASIQATQKYGAGAGASRLITGSHPLYTKLEETLSGLKQTESAIVFGSGYLANLGIIQALVGKNDIILADKLSHACIIDGIKLSGAKFFRFKHNDMCDLENSLKRYRNKYNNCLIISESIFSMDGDFASIDKIAELAKQYDSWSMVDDAHGLGITNPNNKISLQVGTFSKAAGSYGGYVCCNKKIADFLINKSRSLIYSTALPPSALAASIKSLEIISKDHARIKKPLELAELFCSKLNIKNTGSQIVPLIVGTENKALDLSKSLEDKGYLVTAIRPPTVSPGTARLRFTFSSLHTEEQVKQLANIVSSLWTS